MLKYAFKVYLENGNAQIINPSGMQATDLVDMDRFVRDNNGSFGVIEKIARDNNLSTQEIKKVTILRLNKQVEFSIISNNPYLSPVLDTTERKTIKGDRNYSLETTVVTESPEVQSMRGYLFQYLRGNYQTFFKDVYDYHNEFSNLLNRYANLYHQEINSEEDSRELRRLELQIEEDLKIYKNYRGLCLARYRHEHYANSRKVQNYKPITKPKTTPVNNLKVGKTEPEEITLEPLTQEQANQINLYVNELGEEKEEFLEVDEIERYR